MPGKRQAMGKCAFCNRDYTKRGMARHLAICPERGVAPVASRKRTISDGVYYLRAQDCEGYGFWLDLEIHGWGTLDDLDQFLREEWLGCCDDHESGFYIDVRHSFEVAKSNHIHTAFENVKRVYYSLLTGGSSVLASCYISVVKVRVDARSSELRTTSMARNVGHDFTCRECCKPAVEFCSVCSLPDELWEDTYCEQHGSVHLHDQHSFMLPLVNSPRQGICENHILVEW